MNAKIEVFLQITLIWVGLLILVNLFRFPLEYREKEKNVSLKSFLKDYWNEYKEHFWGIVIFGTITAVFAALNA